MTSINSNSSKAEISLAGRDFLDLRTYTKAELEALITLALAMKRGEDTQKYLQDKYLGMLFSVASTRTRISFQVAAKQLGGHAEYYNSSDLQLKNNESLKDTAAVMSRYLDAIIVRHYDMAHYGMGRAALEALATYSDKPIINALDDKDHPCQVMADILTLAERYGTDYKQKKIVMSWVYSKRQKSPGVLHSTLSAAALLGMQVTFAHPKGFELDEEYVSFAEQAAKQSGGKIEFCNDLNEAVEDAHVIYGKNWKSLSMSTEEDARVREEIKEDWCINADHFRRANPDAYYMDCMPFIRGEQVTSEVADGPQSIIYDQAENRLHIQKAILASLLA